MNRVVSGDYGRTSDTLVLVNTLISCLTVIRTDRKNNRLQNFNRERPAELLSREADDNTRLLRFIGKSNVPGLSKLMTIQFRNGGRLSSFVDKCVLSSELKTVGDISSRRQLFNVGAYKRTGSVIQKLSETSNCNC